MKNHLNRMNRTAGFIAAFAITLGLAAIPASAQQATFNLPVPAHWGNAVLQPGRHSVEIPLPMDRSLVYLLSNGASQMAVTLTTGVIPTSDTNYLHLTKVNGVYYVDEYFSGSTGRTFFFHKPKAQRPNPQEAEVTTVKINGN